MPPYASVQARTKMQEDLDNAKDELKRVDHLFYVSLKYTRTADMMRHMVERLIKAFSFGIDSLLKYAKENKKIAEIPSNPAMKAKLLSETFPEDEVLNHINLYLKLRKIIRVSYTQREEYRRHVTMTCTLDNSEVVEVNIDTLKEDYESAKDFIKYVEMIVEGKKEEE
tara:strand:+ start:7802 stop:8305 length:504 start_codon:yes stop_codon:yes gene_type:complete